MISDVLLYIYPFPYFSNLFVNASACSFYWGRALQLLTETKYIFIIYIRLDFSPKFILIELDITNLIRIFIS